jgi:beta-lactam-binding protein with PASTA domain
MEGIAGIKSLQNAGLDIGTIGSACRGTVDKIIEQSIEAKTKVAKGTKVNIVIGAPSVLVNGRPELPTDHPSGNPDLRQQGEVVSGGPADRPQDPVTAFREANFGGS